MPHQRPRPQAGHPLRPCLHRRASKKRLLPRTAARGPERLRQREGYEVLEEVQDPGQSGASLERPGMDRVSDLVAAGGVSVVLGTGQGPLRPRACLPLPPAARVRGVRNEDPGAERQGRRHSGGRAHRRHPGPARQVRAGKDSRKVAGEASSARPVRERSSPPRTPITASSIPSGATPTPSGRTT